MSLIFIIAEAIRKSLVGPALQFMLCLKGPGCFHRLGTVPDAFTNIGVQVAIHLMVETEVNGIWGNENLQAHKAKDRKQKILQVIKTKGTSIQGHDVLVDFLLHLHQPVHP